MGSHRVAADQKKAARLGAHLVFADETGFFMSPLVRRSWAPVGQTPLMRQRTRGHQRVSAIGALTVSPRRRRLNLFWQLHPRESIRQEHLLTFLRQLLRHLRGPVVLVWDRISTHRGGQIRRYVQRQPRLHVELLPGYAPELNPIEPAWGWVKTNPLANFCPQEISEITRAVTKAIRPLRAKRNLLRGFIRATPLPLRLKTA